ncbi:MAG: D-serine ammonia-lyase, partial [Clostridiales bacterium]|nr:D-serine ammonia-lyase [Clostridiales bacterium]
MNEAAKRTLEEYPGLAGLLDGNEQGWLNPMVLAAKTEKPDARSQPRANSGVGAGLSVAGIDDAEARLERFAPFLAAAFPETAPAGGLIESPLVKIGSMRRMLVKDWGADIRGRLLIKLDSELPVAGSVKARGGIHAVLKVAETLALAHGIEISREALRAPKARELFGRYSIETVSTGNLGLSIG